MDGGLRRTVSRRSGFTLIELICVVTILGIAVALAAIRLDYLVPKYRLRGAAREVGALLKQAKSKAASAGRDVYFQIDVSQGEYWMLVPFPKTNDDGTPKEPPEWEYQEIFRRALPRETGSGVEFANVILGADQKVDSGKALVRISPFGASNHVIVNLRLGDAPMSVRMNGLTGVLSFSESHKEADELLEDQGE